VRAAAGSAAMASSSLCLNLPSSAACRLSASANISPGARPRRASTIPATAAWRSGSPDGEGGSPTCATYGTPRSHGQRPRCEAALRHACAPSLAHGPVSMRGVRYLLVT